MFGEGDHRGWIGGIRDAIDPHGVSIRLGQRDLGLCTEVQRDIADGAGQVDDELIRSVFGGWAGDLLVDLDGAEQQVHPDLSGDPFTEGLRTGVAELQARLIPRKGVLDPYLHRRPGGVGLSGRHVPGGEGDIGDPTGLQLPGGGGGEVEMDADAADRGPVGVDSDWLPHLTVLFADLLVLQVGVRADTYPRTRDRKSVV